MTDKKKRGRPPGSKGPPRPPESIRKTRSIRLSAQRYEKLRRLGGSRWIEKKIDEEPEKGK